MGRTGMRRDEVRRIEEAEARNLDRFIERRKRGASIYRTSHGRKLTPPEGSLRRFA
jgi:hypothetical protein